MNINVLLMEGTLVYQKMIMNTLNVSVYHHNESYYQVLSSGQNKVLELKKAEKPSDLNLFFKVFNLKFS